MLIVVVAMKWVPQAFFEWTNAVRLIPGVQPLDGTVKAEKDAIKEAMITAVESASPGDVVAQEDVRFYRDPFASPLQDGAITMLTERHNRRHWCPRAFRFANVDDASAVVEAWRRDTRQCCYGWQSIPKIGHIAGRHPEKKVENE